MFEIATDTALLLALAAFVAGFIDSIAGGGGMISVPALLLAGLSPVEALGTNKWQSLWGSGSATLAYASKGHVDLRAQLPFAALAAIGGGLGAFLATRIPGEWMQAFLPVLLIAIALYFAFKPNMGDVDRHRRLSPFAFGATVVAIDVDAAKLEAIAAHGASLTLNVKEHDPKSLKAAISAFAKSKGLRSTEWFVFECSGTAAGQTTAWGLLVHGATLSVVGFTMDKVDIRLSNLMAFDARAIGNWGCPPESYPAALDLVLDGKVALAPFVETHPLAEINRVFDAVHHRTIRRRAVLVPA